MVALLCCGFLLLLLCNIVRKWACLRSFKHSFGRAHNRRMISLRLKNNFTQVGNPTFTLKLIFVFVVFLSNTKPSFKSSSPNNNEMSRLDRSFFSISSLDACNRVSESQLTLQLKLMALSKLKPSRHKYFYFLILLSGDICLNPGPVKYPCSSCLKPVAKTHKALSCDKCGLWAHKKCERISDKKYQQFMKTPEDKLFFVCSPCLSRNLPFANEESFGDEIPDNINITIDENFDFEAIRNGKGLKMAHLNINGLSSKLDYVKLLLHQTKLDVFSICETKIDDTITDNDVKIDGYVCYRNDRNRRGGGVLIFVNENLDSHLLKHLYFENVESLWVKVCLKKTKPIYVCGVYRPPGGSDLQSTENLCTHFKQCFNKFPKEKEVFILGDFNCNMLSKYALSSKIKELCSTLFLKQHITEPTRVTENSSTLIDLILSNSSCISKTGVMDLGISDHNLVYVIRKFKRPKFEPKTCKVRSYKNFSEEAFLKDLRNLDWSYFNNYDDLDKACEKLNKNVKTVADKHAPFKTHRFSGRVEAWVTDELIIAIKERDFLKRKASKTKSIIDWEAFKQKRNQVIGLKNRLKNEYYNDVLQDFQKRPKQLWKTIKKLVPDKSGNTTSIKRVVQNDGTETSHPKEISNTFNSFFVSVGAKLASKFSSDTTNVNPPVSGHDFRWARIETKSVEKIIRSLKLKGTVR
ncbi:uncharacterized protein LOC130624320 [Hydractinia symbiolongicarpus]|uniref:uncharacterized protein LOC130624320 n=1 Tax=Hydractinia symbiolongicarpus TaxID=13093 RepID=UPI002549DA80|nr:uncharacterized protein LOC130624320 [Hydractinia symbiolongicarpus]XP_057295888.1 uncharacterized protein LOC130624320 [Hydractinia symbiolongicarpus]XP_057295889.1 uncharacterized protein LOC130624320 [Hydractinia symbiolongicarpus]XP_057295890.1 uncharacterized protein LOC130624320 [Hydractinia symbiolongicarpus]